MGKQHGGRGKVEADMRTQVRGRGENKLKNQGIRGFKNHQNLTGRR
jgi:hypothetical protein